jgi:hypothetical protein
MNKAGHGKGRSVSEQLLWGKDQILSVTKSSIQVPYIVDSSVTVSLSVILGVDFKL